MPLSIHEISCDGRTGMLAGFLCTLYLSQFGTIDPVLKVMEISSPAHPEIMEKYLCNEISV